MKHPITPTRRDLIKTGSAALALGATAALAGASRKPKADILRVGLVGCGGRGTGAAADALRADPNVELVAMGDTFGDRLESSLRTLQGNGDVGSRVKVDEAHRYTGFDAYKKVTDAVDVVLLATSPHFRPIHVAYAVEKGRHVFVEKPVATDALGVKSIRESCQLAATKSLSIVSGLCYRYQHAKRETVKRIQEGAIGDIVAIKTTYNTGGLWHRGRAPEWSEMEYQIRNWLYFGWLSGDHIGEQHIHSLDKVAWVMGGYPSKCTASGGRIVRTDPKYGNIYDHFNSVFEWENGVQAFSSCRQWVGAASDVSDHIFGSEGKAEMQSHRIERKGERAWRYRGEGPDNMYQNEHNEFFASIRSGQPINNGEYMADSTLMAIMGRMSAYTGQTITWDQVKNSTLDLSPKSYEWTDNPMRPVPQPGITKFS
ncbi:MAG: putative dehydrogenase [Planctomycetota bacterium]|jgi:predicted dehydrogenase